MADRTALRQQQPVSNGNPLAACWLQPVDHSWHRLFRTRRSSSSADVSRAHPYCSTQTLRKNGRALSGARLDAALVRRVQPSTRALQPRDRKVSAINAEEQARGVEGSGTQTAATVMVLRTPVSFIANAVNARWLKNEARGQRPARNATSTELRISVNDIDTVQIARPQGTEVARSSTWLGDDAAK